MTLKKERKKKEGQGRRIQGDRDGRRKLDIRYHLELVFESIIANRGRSVALLGGLVALLSVCEVVTAKTCTQTPVEDFLCGPEFCDFKKTFPFLLIWRLLPSVHGYLEQRPTVVMAFLISEYIFRSSSGESQRRSQPLS